ncbi:MAG: Ku protein, partial [Ramlibacter sp.]|nr:Ku protein [Ramlibacter sp.]
GADVIDLLELLKRSLKGGKAATAPTKKAAGRKAPARAGGPKGAPAKSTTRRAA